MDEAGYGIDTPLTILHVIGGLQQGGGAEEILYRLVLENNRNRHVVMSLQDEGYYGPELRNNGVEVLTLGLDKSPASLMKLLSIFSKIKTVSPDVVQTWLYYSDFIGGVCARLAGVENVVWGIHHSTRDPGGSMFSSQSFARLCAWISKYVPSTIISVSKTGASMHIGMGYAADKFVVIPNGYDLTEFTDGEESEKNIDDREKLAETSMNQLVSLREVYSIADDIVLLGMVARFIPLKDHQNLFAALSRLSELGHDKWVCFLFGKDISGNAALNELMLKYDVQHNIVAYGLSNTIAAHVRQLDLVVLSSLSEAFPNVLNEAMASKVPCVSTDVGDARVIVGEYGWIVPVSDSSALAEAIGSAIDEKRNEPEKWEQRRSLCREHIARNFTLKHMAEAYEVVWRRGCANSGTMN